MKRWPSLHATPPLVITSVVCRCLSAWNVSTATGTGRPEASPKGTRSAPRTSRAFAVTPSRRAAPTIDRLPRPHLAGDLGVGADAALVAAAKESDLILAFGTRMGEPVSQGYTLLDMAGATPIVRASSGFISMKAVG